MDLIELGTPNDYPVFWKRVFLVTLPISVPLFILYWLLLIAIIYLLEWFTRFCRCCYEFWHGEPWDWTFRR